MYNLVRNSMLGLVPCFASIMRPDVYLELGILRGGTIREVSKYAKKAIGVDINSPGETSGYTFYHMSTDDFFERLKNREITIPPLDMVFIDACHSYEQSLRDFDNVFDYVCDNGLIFLHDTYPECAASTSPRLCGEVYKTAWDIRTRYVSKCEIVTIPHTPGMSIVRKSSKQLDWI